MCALYNFPVCQIWHFEQTQSDVYSGWRVNTTAIFRIRFCTAILLTTVFLDIHRNEAQHFLFSHYYYFFFFFQMLDQRIWDWNSSLTLRNACDWSSRSASAFVSEEFRNTMVPLHDAYLYGDKSSTHNSFSHTPVSITILIIFFCAWKCCFVDVCYFIIK